MYSVNEEDSEEIEWIGDWNEPKAGVLKESQNLSNVVFSLIEMKYKILSQ